jgi:hypothetical protein
MTKYKVLKELPGCEVGKEFNGPMLTGSSTMVVSINEMVAAGFLEEIKDDEVWSRGVKINIAKNQGGFYIDSTGKGKFCGSATATFRDNLTRGLIFNSRDEAERYAEHLRIENELINIGVRKYKGSTKYSDEYYYCVTAHANDDDDYLISLEGIYFKSYFIRDEFEKDNAKLLEQYAGYYVEEE